MKTFAMILAGTALALTGATAASAQTRQEKNEARLAKMLEGRVAGEPVSCISTLRSNNDLQVIDYVGIVYDAGDTIWVSRPNDPKSLTWSDIPIFDRFGSQLCKQDITRTIDQSGNFTGIVFMGDFVPYRKG